MFWFITWLFIHLFFFGAAIFFVQICLNCDLIESYSSDGWFVASVFVPAGVIIFLGAVWFANKVS